MKRFSELFYLSLIVFISYSKICYAEKLTLKNIFKEYVFYPERIITNHCKFDNKYFTYLKDYSFIIKRSYSDSNYADTLLSCKGEPGDIITYILNYQISDDGRYILLSTNSERIYRYSYLSNYYLWDLFEKKLISIYENKKILYAEISPDNLHVAFISENNIYLTDIKNNDVNRITDDGEINKIINGAPDWLYEEEFTLLKGIEWSPDGSKLAFYQIDESDVNEMQIPRFNGTYPTYYTFKYPKAGEKNPKVQIKVFDVNTGKMLEINTGTETDIYLPRIKWTNNCDSLSIIILNRPQNKIDYLIADAVSGKTKNIHSESCSTFISDVKGDYVWFTENNKMIFYSENEGYNQIYSCDLNGKNLKKLTPGPYDINDILGTDNSEFIYYTAFDEVPYNLNLFKVNINTGEIIKLTGKEGWNTAQVNISGNYYIWEYSSAKTPFQFIVCSSGGESRWIIEDNRQIVYNQNKYNYSPKKFGSYTINGNQLYGYTIEPVNFNKKKKYPVLINVYGGTGSQEVINRWDGARDEWFQYLSQQGYIIACVDNRGTGGRGVDFRKCVFGKLSEFEVEDQISFAKLLGKLPYMDKDRIGIFGWSNGGYISLLCLEKGADYYKTGISVAPITHWKYYDTGYTERYMKKPDENNENYEKSSPLNYSYLLKSSFLLVHGTADDNVHFQNSAELIKTLIENNKQYELLIYPDSDHNMIKGNATFHLYTSMSKYLFKNL